jgi:16S rRNA (guanine(966)-N(2))-methyltransferase RsmD
MRSISLVEHAIETWNRMRAETKPGRVRIIGGRYRRTPIPVIAAPGLRPTPDRVRETVFNWLEHLLGTLDGIAVLDLFAGSGALGFEAASRGAGRAVLVDSNARAAAALLALQQRLGATAVEVIQADWRAASARLAPASFDLVFLDPPFGSGLLPAALAAARRVLKPDGLIYVESGEPPTDEAAAAGLEVVRNGKAGVVVFQLLRAPAQ